MTKKAKQNVGKQDIDLTNTFIGQSSNHEITKSLSPSLSDMQSDLTHNIAVSNHSPSVSNDQGHDLLSRSQLCKEQHSDPEILPLFERTLDENEIS